MLTPARRRGVEILDDPSVDPEIRVRSIDDVTRSNRLLGGLRAATRTFTGLLPALPDGALVLDVGTGLGDIPAAMKNTAGRAGTRITTIGMDEAFSLLDSARGRVDLLVCADACALPFRSRSIDVVTASQVLHHFEDADALRLIAEMNRVTKRFGLIVDLRRSRLAALGFWALSWPLRFHRVTRHDGVVSVYRGFTAKDLRGLAEKATGRAVLVRRWLGFRLTALWDAARRPPA